MGALIPKEGWLLCLSFLVSLLFFNPIFLLFPPFLSVQKSQGVSGWVREFYGKAFKRKRKPKHSPPLVQPACRTQPRMMRMMMMKSVRQEQRAD